MVVKKRAEPDGGGDISEQPFPRGGASVLTPLEERKLKLQAEADFERDGSHLQPKRKIKKLSGNAFGDVEEVRAAEAAFRLPCTR
jgi:hypothetical protein